MTPYLLLLAGFFAGIIATVLYYGTRPSPKPPVPQDRRCHKPPRAWPIRDGRGRLIAYDRRLQADRRLDVRG
jgi:hypothetical protein